MTDTPPVAMIRGTRARGWGLYDRPGPEYPGQFTETTPLAWFVGEYSEARADASRWCEQHGYYLSSYSDADDRDPDSGGSR